MAKETGDPLKIHGIDRLDEDALRKALAAAKAKQAKTKILTKDRAAADQRVTELHQAADRAHRVRTSKLGKGDPAKLWTTPNKDRHTDYLGAIVQVGMGVPSDAINAIASGAKAGPGMLEGEQRKAILGGLVALHAAGADVDIKGLKAPIVGSKAVNEALARAAGMPGKTLEQVYDGMVKRIARYGSAMRALAWSYREQLWLKDVAGIEKVHAASGAVVALFVPIGTAVGAAIGGHSAITLAVARVLSLKAEATIKASLPGAKAELGAPRGAGAKDEPVGAGAGEAGPGPVLWILGLGVLGLGGAYFYHQSEAS